MTDPSLITPGKLILTFLSYFLHRAVMRNGLSDRDKDCTHERKYVYHYSAETINVQSTPDNSSSR